MTKKATEKPSLDQIRQELKRENDWNRFFRVLWSTIFTLVVVAAITVLVAVLWLPVLEIYGTSMSPTLEEGEIVLSIKYGELERGDIVAFYYGNKLLVKRVIGLPGELLEITEEGDVLINGEPLEEPYLTEKSLGESDVEYPIEIPLEQYFVMGDRRTTSLDSRTTAVGCVTEEDVVGKVLFGIWPFAHFGWIGE
ncbi:MAG: signal peptidase I [bacterium]